MQKLLSLPIQKAGGKGWSLAGSTEFTEERRGILRWKTVNTQREAFSPMAVSLDLSHYSFQLPAQSQKHHLRHDKCAGIAKSTSECDSRLPALWIRQEEHLHRTDVWNTPNKLLYVEFTSYFMQRCQGNESA